MKKQNGITLVLLIIIIAVLLILASVSVKFGTESMDVTRLKGFYLELEIVQKRVDEIFVKNETYSVKNEDGTETKVEMKNAGVDLTDEQKNSLQSILQAEEINIDVSTFRYFTIEDINNILDITDINYDLFINFEKRIIVAEQGIEIAGKRYHVLKNDIYFVEQNDKNTGEIKSLIYSEPIEYGINKYKITVTPENTIGDIGGTGYVKYQKVGASFWLTSQNNEIVIEPNKVYNIKYIDNNNNSLEKMIKIELIKNQEGNEVPTILEVENEREEI